MWVARGLGFIWLSVPVSEIILNVLPMKQRENRRWVRSMAWAWLGLCEGKEKPVERGSSGRRAGGPTGEVQAKNLQQEDLRIKRNLNACFDFCPPNSFALTVFKIVYR